MKIGYLINILSDFDEDEDYVIEVPGFGNDFVVDEIERDPEDGTTVVIKLNKDSY
jgi:hypothetical protein